MTADEYIIQRIDDQIRWHSKKSTYNKKWHNSLRIIEIVLSVSIPVFAGYTSIYPRLALVTGILGAIIAAIAGISGVCKFHDNWIVYRCITEGLHREKMLYLSKTGPYSGDCCYNILVERSEEILARGTKEWSETLKPTEKKAASF